MAKRVSMSGALSVQKRSKTPVFKKFDEDQDIVRLAVTVPKSMRTALKIAVANDGTTITETCTKALLEYLEDFQKRNPDIDLG